jgi:hypothetical protein
VYNRARAERERLGGREHRYVIGVIERLAAVYMEQNRPDETERLFIRVLSWKERTLGREHWASLKTIRSLGKVYADQGRFEEAEQMHERARRG